MRLCYVHVELSNCYQTPTCNFNDEVYSLCSFSF